MKEIIIKVIPKIIRVKWEMGIKMLFKKYDIGFIIVKIDGEEAKLMFHDIISLLGAGSYTTYNMRNGTTYLRCESLANCCRELPLNHFGRYRKNYVMNYHFYVSHSLGKICIVELFGGHCFTVSLDEMKRFYKENKFFKIGVGLIFPRVSTKKP
jgi:hypothetical protein